MNTNINTKIDNYFLEYISGDVSALIRILSKDNRCHTAVLLIGMANKEIISVAETGAGTHGDMEILPGLIFN